MPSNPYVFCGYDMLGPGSQAGKAGYGLNLNSVTTQYTLRSNPALAKSVFEGMTPSHFDSSPTVTDGGVLEIDPQPIDEKGASMNPMQLAQAQSPFPTASFSGALGIYRDQFQPTFGMSQYNPSGMYGGYGFQGFNPNGFMPINYTPPGYVPYNFAPANPSVAITSNGFAMEWNEYQRRQGFRAPIPEKAIYEGDGFLSGFHEGFDPYAALAPQPDEFYDPTAAGRFTLQDAIKEQALRQAAYTWGWQPGQVIERREQLMFPGINEDHKNPRPKDDVKDHSGRPQKRLGNSSNTSIPASSLPVSDMVSTNPFMRGVSQVGGYNFGGMMHVPSPYMQARYNYAIANGFQSVQEMDNNDFRILKILSRGAHEELDWDSFEEYFDNTFCKIFKKDKKKQNVTPGMPGQRTDDPDIPRMKVTLRKGDQILASSDMSNDMTYHYHVQAVRQIIREHMTPQQRAMEEANLKAYWEAKYRMMAILYTQAPERKYDKDGSMLDFMKHGFVESIMQDLVLSEELRQRNPKTQREKHMVNQTAFLRNTLERGMGIALPGATSRIEMENRMFYKGEPLPDEEFKDAPRGSFGVDATGKLMDPSEAPMFGYTSYIPDPEHPERSIGFPRRFIEEVFEGYVRYCNSINGHSRKNKIIPMDHDSFIEALGVTVHDDDDYLKRFGSTTGADKFIDAAKRGVGFGYRSEDDDFLAALPDDVPFELIKEISDETAEQRQSLE